MIFRLISPARPGACQKYEYAICSGMNIADDFTGGNRFKFSISMEDLATNPELLDAMGLYSGSASSYKYDTPLGNEVMLAMFGRYIPRETKESATLIMWSILANFLPNNKPPLKIEDRLTIYVGDPDLQREVLRILKTPDSKPFKLLLQRAQ